MSKTVARLSKDATGIDFESLTEFGESNVREVGNGGRIVFRHPMLTEVCGFWQPTQVAPENSKEPLADALQARKFLVAVIERTPNDF